MISATRAAEARDATGVRVLAADPLFSAFGCYLTSRPDLVPRDVCAGLSGEAPPSPMEDVRRIFEADFGCSLDDTFESFDSKPFEASLLTQSHRAWLTPTDAVRVKILRRPQTHLEGDAERLSRLAPVFASVMTRPVFEAAVADFLDQIRRRMDLRHEVASGRLLADDARSFRALRAARYYPQLCSDRVAVREHLACVPLETPGFDRASAARRVCLAWLRQALFGSVFPEEPRPEDFLILGRGQVAFAGGVFRSLPPATQAVIQSYLAATAAGDPDWALECLSGELKAVEGADPSGLRGRLRHAPRPLHEGAIGGSKLLSELVFHWRLFDEYGYRPSRHVLAFYRGCLLAVRAAAGLSAAGARDPDDAGNPGTDVLRDSLDVLQARIVVHQTELALGLSNLRERSVAEVVSRFVDETVNGDRVDGSGLSASPHGESRPARMAVVAALVLALGAVALVAPRVASALGEAGEPLGAAIYTVLGVTSLLAIAGWPRRWWR